MNVRKVAERMLRGALPAVMLAATALGPVAPLARAEGETPAAELKAAVWQNGAPETARIVPNTGAEERPAGLAGSSAASASADALNPVINWSRIAFQSYRDGNSEIYTGRADATNLTRLTFDPAGDAYPAIRPDLSRVVFSSNRAEFVDLYSVHLDGSGLTRLTYDEATDYRPVWSPDGQRIAWRFTQNGLSQLLLMNADGSGRTVVPGMGGTRSVAWSPDGTKLAVVRQSGDAQSLTVVTLNGEHVASGPGDMHFAGQPEWSPDGKNILIDYDADGDAWNELVVVPFVIPFGGTPRIVYDPNTDFVDAWSGAWSPDGETLLFTLALWEVVDNELALSGGYLATIPAGGGQAALLPGTLGVDFQPDWVSTDITPPVTAFDPLPPFAPIGSIPLSWWGMDNGGSGLAVYDVEVSRNGGPWERIVNGESRTTGALTAMVGGTYRFRVRARDRAGNVEAWTDGGDATVNVYAAQVLGRTMDARGFPVGGADVSINPAALNAGPSGLDGLFARFLREGVSIVETQAAAPGYAAPDPIRLNLRDDLPDLVDTGRADFALADAANWISNGGFESGGFGAWQANGATLFASVGGVHGGNSAALLGQANDLTAPVEVLRGFRAGLVEAGGVTHVVAVQSTAGGQRLVYNRRDAAGHWLAQPAALHEAAGVIDRFTPAPEQQGGLRVYWMTPGSGGYLVEGCRVAPGATTCAATPISSEWPYLPRVVADAAGVAHALWVRQDDASGLSLMYAKEMSAGWGAGEPVGSGPNLSNYALAVDQDGRPGALWAELPSGDDPLTLTRYNERGASEWPAPQQVASGPYRYGTHWLAYGADGSAHALIYETPGAPPATVLYTSSPAGGAWSALTPVTTNASALTLNVAGATPQVAYMSDRTLEQRALVAGQWQTVGRWALGPQEVVESVALEAGGAVALVERMLESSEPVLYRRSRLAGAAAVSSLSRQVTIPAGAHEPTLSFFMKPSAGIGDAFTVTVEAGGKVEPLQLNVSGAGWQHAWADLRKWAGQTVTLRFAVTQAAGRPFAQVALDDVTAGPWLTPGVAIAFVRDGQVIIGGGNFISPTVKLDEQTLTITEQGASAISAALPVGVKPGRHTVWVVNAGGQRMGAVVTAGRQVFLPVAR